MSFFMHDDTDLAIAATSIACDELFNVMVVLLLHYVAWGH